MLRIDRLPRELPPHPRSIAGEHDRPQFVRAQDLRPAVGQSVGKIEEAVALPVPEQGGGQLPRFLRLRAEAVFPYLPDPVLPKPLPEPFQPFLLLREK